MVVVTKYDRLARSLKDLLEIAEQIQEKGAGFRSLAEDIDTTTPAVRPSFHVFASIAQCDGKGLQREPGAAHGDGRLADGTVAVVFAAQSTERCQ